MCKWLTCSEKQDLMPEHFLLVLSALQHAFNSFNCLRQLQKSKSYLWEDILEWWITFLYFSPASSPNCSQKSMKINVNLTCSPFFLPLSLSVCPPLLLPPVWSELNQNRLLVNGSPVELWLVSECKQPPCCCCLFSTGLMMCSLDYSGSLSFCIFPPVTFSLPLSTSFLFASSSTFSHFHCYPHHFSFSKINTYSNRLWLQSPTVIHHDLDWVKNLIHCYWRSHLESLRDIIYLLCLNKESRLIQLIDWFSHFHPSMALFVHPLWKQLTSVLCQCHHGCPVCRWPSAAQWGGRVGSLVCWQGTRDQNRGDLSPF